MQSLGLWRLFAESAPAGDRASADRGEAGSYVMPASAVDARSLRDGPATRTGDGPLGRNPPEIGAAPSRALPVGATAEPPRKPPRAVRISHSALTWAEQMASPLCEMGRRLAEAERRVELNATVGHGASPESVGDRPPSPVSAKHRRRGRAETRSDRDPRSPSALPVSDPSAVTSYVHEHQEGARRESCAEDYADSARGSDAPRLASRHSRNRR